MDTLLGGIEGGATHSKIVLYDGLGNKLAQCSGPGLNHWLLGMEECQERIYKMVLDAKLVANINENTPLDSLGMSLSGCEQEETNNQLKQGLSDAYPNLSKFYVVCSDTVGSIAAVHRHGGMVLIAGTGSNGLLLNPDGSQSRCGGWGNMLGDEGSAWWLSQKAIKIYFDEQDRYVKPPHDTTLVWKLIREHFNVANRFDLLDHCYSNYEKSTFAGLCKRIAEGAETGDALCLWLFEQTGIALAKIIRALVPQAQKELVRASGDEGLRVVCVGSVWLSWKFLKEGFIKTLRTVEKGERCVGKLSLLKLSTSMAVGATYLAADAIQCDMPRDYQKNYSVFFNYEPVCKFPKTS